MDPIRNPYAPGAGQRPPELAGRDTELSQFEVLLERTAAGRPERSLILSGLRGVGKTVLLNTLRSMAMQRAWGTGKVEARPGQSIRIPVAQAMHAATRELVHRHRDPDRGDGFLATLKAFALKTPQPDRVGMRWTPPLDVVAAKGRADSGDLEMDLVELFGDASALARDLGVGIALFIDEMQDLSADDLSAICAACHEVSQQSGAVVVVGAGLPHLPTLLSASKSYSERLFRYLRIDRLSPQACARALELPAQSEGAAYEPAAVTELYEQTGGYPYFVQAFAHATWDSAPGSPITAADVRAAAPAATAELGVGFFGSRYERATAAEREYLQAMADTEGDEGAGVATSVVAEHLGRKPQSLSPARDALIKKGLIYSGERGLIAFTVPHFGRFLRGR